MNLECLFFGHVPSHFVDGGRPPEDARFPSRLFYSEPVPICGKCNRALSEEYFNRKLPEVIQAGVA